MIEGLPTKALMPCILRLALVLCAALAGTLALVGSASAASNGVLAWGANGTGQLGDGADTGPEECAPGEDIGSPCSIVPVAVSGLSEAKSIAAGSSHALALLNGGTVVSWGSNSVGQLGVGETAGPQLELSTTPVAVGGLSEVAQVAASEDFSLALLKDGTVMAWGANEGGVLGNLTTQFSSVPVAVGGLSEVTQVAAGRGFALALLKNGTVMGWGDDADGQLGAGDIPGPKRCEVCFPTPVAVSGLSEVTAIAAGERSSFAVLRDGTVMAWGGNVGGQLGDGTRTDSDVPVAVSGLSEVTAIAASEWSGFAVLRDGRVMAWGENEEGVLGDGSEMGSEVPVAVCAVGEQAPCAQDLSGVTAVSASSKHALALLGNGTVVAWGDGERGELGEGYYPDVARDGTFRGSEVPVAVDGLSEATAISAGGRFSFAVGELAPLPRVIGLNPRSGPVGGGASVRITGSNFTGVTAVRFGSSAACFTVDSETEITAIAPSGAGMAYVTLPGGDVTPPGTVFVTVQSVAGTSPASTSGDLFSYGLPTAEAATGNCVAPSSGGSSSPAPGGTTLVSPLVHPVTPEVLTSSQRLAKALRQCQRDKSKTRRAVCEKRARVKYATTARRANGRKRHGARTGRRMRSGR